MSQYNPLKDHADYLRSFWDVYGGLNRSARSPQPKDRVITALQIAGTKHIYYSIQGATPELREQMRIKARVKFDKLKNVRHKYRLKAGYECLACGDVPKVRHHIIWLKNGGRNNKRNISYLCHPCHSEVHPWLKANS